MAGCLCPFPSHPSLFLQPLGSLCPSEPSLLLFPWDSVSSRAQKIKANSGGLWLIAGSPPHCPLLGEVTRVAMVGHRSPAESPRAAKQAQDKRLHSTYWNRSNVVLKKLRLASFGEGPGLAPFNSQTNSCGMLQLLVTIPLPAWDFDFRFRHVKLGGWLGLEQLGGCGGRWLGKILCSILCLEARPRGIRRCSSVCVIELFSPCGRFPGLEIGSLCGSGSFCPLKHKCLGIILWSNFWSNFPIKVMTNSAVLTLKSYSLDKQQVKIYQGDILVVSGADLAQRYLETGGGDAETAKWMQKQERNMAGQSTSRCLDSMAFLGTQVYMQTLRANCLYLCVAIIPGLKAHSAILGDEVRTWTLVRLLFPTSWLPHLL